MRGKSHRVDIFFTSCLFEETFDTSVVLIGTRGVRLKSQLPCIYAYADNFGLTLAARNKCVLWGKRVVSTSDG